MKLRVPFYKQTTPLNCGPTALRMVIAFLDKDPGIDILEKGVGIKEGKSTSTIQIATAAALLGYKTKLFSKNLSFDSKNFELEFYKKYAEEGPLGQAEKLIQKAKEAGVELQEKLLTQEEILSFVTENSLPIILIDWNVLKDNKGYKGQKAFMAIDRKVLNKARKAQGTDEDVLVIYKNQKI